MATKKATSTAKRKPAAKTTVRKTTSKVTSRAAAASPAGVLQKSLRDVAFWRSLGAEFIGTFLLAVAVIAGQGQPIIILFALAAIVLIIGTVSGAHVNPAITIGAWVTRRITWVKAVGYILAQVLGAALAFVTLSAFLGATEPVSAEAALYGATNTALFSAADLVAGKEWFVVFAELLGTTVLAFAIATALRARDTLTSAFTAGLGIYIALLLAATAASYAAASAIINPAIGIALQAIAWDWSIAVYIVAPVVGSIIGFGLHDLVKGKKN